MSEQTITWSYHNTEHGSRPNTKEVTRIDNRNQVLDELQEFRLFILLQNTLVETELKYLKSILKVVEEKANKVDILKTY